MNLKDSVILITGGTGSFGSRVAARLLEQEPAAIRIYSRDERKQEEMRRCFPQFRYMLGDVRDLQRLTEAMAGVDYVFHAAALKQVPSCEEYPMEAFKTNVLGSHNACEAARANNVKALVALSTDKAVKPVNAMGMSKAMMEKIVCNQNQFSSETIFCCVRYCNVMGSRGSVIPLFKKQIADGKPLTVTVPSMTRFLMTMGESVDLVLHALAKAQGGEIFVLKSPACSVQVLAEAMRRKYSAHGEHHPIETIGIRPGEKVHEVLVSEYEMQRVVEEDGSFTIHPEYWRNGYFTQKPVGEEYTSANTRQLTEFSEIEAALSRVGVDSYI